MTFWRYIFSFLFVRNWYTGHLELSRPRLFLFITGLILLCIAAVVIAVMQAPVEYLTA